MLKIRGMIYETEDLEKTIDLLFELGKWYHAIPVNSKTPTDGPQIKETFIFTYGGDPPYAVDAATGGCAFNTLEPKKRTQPSIKECYEHYFSLSPESYPRRNIIQILTLKVDKRRQRGGKKYEYSIKTDGQWKKYEISYNFHFDEEKIKIGYDLLPRLDFNQEKKDHKQLLGFLSAWAM